MKNPMFFNEIASGLTSFSHTLGTLNLPGLASQSFFAELIEKDECICGEKCAQKEKKIIKSNSQKYLKRNTSIPLMLQK